MFYCENCYRHFIHPKLVEEGYGMPYPWRQQFDACPHCGIVGMFGEVEEHAG